MSGSIERIWIAASTPLVVSHQHIGDQHVRLESRGQFERFWQVYTARASNPTWLRIMARVSAMTFSSSAIRTGFGRIRHRHQYNG